MILITMNQELFEQDIRALLMAFYPGEEITMEPGKVWDRRLLFLYTEDTVTVTSELSPGKVEENTITIDPGSRLEAKSALKRLLYHIISKETKKTLPWGTLTGIRPVKIAMGMLEAGMKPEEIRRDIQERYLTSTEKTDLSIAIAERERELLKQMDYQDGYSLYVGIPFCPTTCLYCSFTSFPIDKWEQKVPDYMAAMFREIDYIADTFRHKRLNTIYIGGGTPTALSAAHLKMLLQRISERFSFADLKEFTVEAGRPDSITREKLQVLKEFPVTRISINPQTMKDATLTLIGRKHTVLQVKETFHMAREEGFDNINMDLIMGLPGEGLADVRTTLEEIKKLAPDSVTVHSLAIKRAARLNMFKEQYVDLKIENTDEMIALTSEYAKELGMEPYYLYRQKNMAGNFENVGYAAPGKAGIYNILIMEEKQTILAVGAGASSKIVFPLENRLERVENVKSVEQYIERIDEMIARKEKILANL